MSQQACRWKWCRQTYPTVVELLSHVSQEHVRNTEFCSLRDIPMHMRAEEGTGDSMSGMTVNAASYVLSGTQDHDNLSSSLPSPPATSPIPHLPLPEMDLDSPQGTQARPSKRRKMPPVTDPSLSPSHHNSARQTAHTPSPRISTPPFLTLASPELAVVPNPEMPNLDALLSNSIASRSRQRPISTPETSNENHSSQSFSGSDRSVERQLTQSADMEFDTSLDVDIMGDPENIYAAEINWADEPSPIIPRYRSQTPSQETQSPSQQQPSSPPFPIDTTPSQSPQLPIRRKQSWYQSPRRVSRPKKTFSDAQQSSPASNLAHQNDAPASNSPSPQTHRQGVSTPTKTYLSGSLKFPSPQRPNQSEGSVSNPDQTTSIALAYQSASQMSSFVIQTQAPYRSQSTSQ